MEHQDANFTPERILELVEAYRSQHGRLPTAESGMVGQGELTWAEVNRRLVERGQSLEQICKAQAAR